ncbi:MAG: acyltransferase [Pseudomonadota bacterium]
MIGKDEMNLIFKTIGYFISLPARVKGMRFGSNSFIHFGYDFFFVSLKNVSVGTNVLIGKKAWIQTIGNARILIGDNTNIGRNFTISSNRSITVGKNVLISYGVSILDHDHEFRDVGIPPINADLTDGKPIEIGDDCFIGASCFILKGVCLGTHCIVAANSVVTKSFPDYSLLGGSPAKLIRSLNEPLNL